MFNDTAFYNIAYGGVGDPEIKKMMRDPARKDELMGIVREAAQKASIDEFF